MKNFVNKAFGIVSFMCVGALGLSSAANAGQLSIQSGESIMNIVFDSGVYFQNNVIDFVNFPGVSSILGGPPNPGLNGNPAPDFGTSYASKGNFTITFSSGAFASSGFVAGKKGAATDLFLPPSLLGSTGGKIVTGNLYDLAVIGAPSPQILLEFDRNNNGIADAKFNFTKFLRTSVQNALGGFDNTISVKGYFEHIADGTAPAFDVTEANLALFNGASSINPESLTVINTPAEFLGSGPLFNSVDSTLGTPQDIPEPSAGLGLLAFLGMMGLSQFVKKQSQN